ncbi:MAG: 50S ribosomal protein L24 [Nanoarchaeota archaeon]|nr:50S ribosomal protein L24 [Nanoarchaeota archaeon]
MVRWSKSWKASIRPRKQRNYRTHAPLHIRQKLVSVHLSKDLRTKHGKRSIAARKGDKVKILRGQFKGKSGNITKVELKNSKIAVEGMENIRKDGTKTPYLFEPSNLMLTELMLEDKKRKKSLEKKAAGKK